MNTFIIMQNKEQLFQRWAVCISCKPPLGWRGAVNHVPPPPFLICGVRFLFLFWPVSMSQNSHDPNNYCKISTIIMLSRCCGNWSMTYFWFLLLNALRGSQWTENLFLITVIIFQQIRNPLLPSQHFKWPDLKCCSLREGGSCMGAVETMKHKLHDSWTEREQSNLDVDTFGHNEPTELLSKMWIHCALAVKPANEYVAHSEAHTHIFSSIHAHTYTHTHTHLAALGLPPGQNGWWSWRKKRKTQGVE